MNIIIKTQLGEIYFSRPGDMISVIGYDVYISDTPFHNGTCLAEYDSCERAHQVMDMIIEHIKDRTYIECQSMNLRQMTDKAAIFVMPED
jgi:hypothetical protein